MIKKYLKENRTDKYPEFVVRTHHVWVVAVLLIAVCVTFFWLGRWYQKKVSQYDPGAGVAQRETTVDVGTDPTENPEDMEQRITFFDRLEPDDSSTAPSEKRAEASPEKTSGDQVGTPPKQIPAEAAGKGSFYTIQVLAGNERSRAMKDSQMLERMGFSSYIKEEKRSSGTLYKVRVGKYSSKAKASEVEARLKKKGYQTWILKTE